MNGETETLFFSRRHQTHINSRIIDCVPCSSVSQKRTSSFFQGINGIIAIFLSGFERKKRLTNSSVRDFPAPFLYCDTDDWNNLNPFDFSSMAATKSGFSSEKFSTAEMILAMLVEFLKLIESKSLASTSFLLRSLMLYQIIDRSCKPSSRPSSE